MKFNFRKALITFVVSVTLLAVIGLWGILGAMFVFMDYNIVEYWTPGLVQAFRLVLWLSLGWSLLVGALE